MHTFQPYPIELLEMNPFTKLGKEWALVTAGNKTKCNTMTVSWGGVGVIWNKNVVYIFVRDSRYTKEFIDQGDFFSLSFLDEKYRPALSYCGSHSGRDGDKMAETGLTPADLQGAVGIEQAELVFVCRKLYSYDMEESGFLTDDGIPAQFFGTDPYHRAYIAEIVGVYVK